MLTFFSNSSPTVSLVDEAHSLVYCLRKAHDCRIHQVLVYLKLFIYFDLILNIP